MRKVKAQASVPAKKRPGKAKAAETKARRSLKKQPAQAKVQRVRAEKPAKGKAVRSGGKAAVAAAKRAKGAPAKKAAPARKAVSAKKAAPAKKLAAARKPAKAAKKPAVAKKITAKAVRPVARQAAGKAAAKKVAAKPAVKKSVTRKPATKPVSRKPVAKAPARAVAKKPAAKKPVARPVSRKPVAKVAARPAARKPLAKAVAKKVAPKRAVAKARPVAKKPTARPVRSAVAKAKPALKPVAAKKAAKAVKARPTAPEAVAPKVAAPKAVPAKPAAKPAAPKAAVPAAPKPVATAGGSNAIREAVKKLKARRPVAQPVIRHELPRLDAPPAAPIIASHSETAVLLRRPQIETPSASARMLAEATARITARRARDMLPVSIQTRRLVLRAPIRGDVPELVKLADNRTIAHWLARLPSPYTRADAIAFVEIFAQRADERAYAITLNGTFIGVVGFSFREGRPPELGYWLGEPYWGQGYMTEAVRGLVDAAHSTGLYGLIGARARAENEASISVLEKTGFKRVGKVDIEEYGGEKRKIVSFELEAPRWA